MAANKKTAAKRKPASKNKNSSATKKTTASKRQQTARKQVADEKRTVSPEVRRQRTAILLVVIAVLLMAATLFRGEKLWLGIHDTIFGLFGICSFAWPLILIYVAYLTAVDKSKVSVRNNIIGASIFVVLLSGIVHVFSDASVAGDLGAQIGYIWDLRHTVTVSSGGVVGAVIGGVPVMLFGKTAAGIVLIVLTLATLMIITGTTLIGIRLWIGNRVEKSRERRLEREYDEDGNTDEEIVRSRKKKKFVPINVDRAPDDDRMIIDELVGNEKKRVVKHDKEAVETVAGGEPAPQVNLDDIIRNANKASGAKQSGESASKKSSVKVEKDSAGEIKAIREYVKPPVSCLSTADNSSAMNYEDELKMNAKKLVSTLESFGVSTKIVDICRGPSVTRYELQPAAGVKISKITGLSDDIALALASTGVRIEAPIPNKSAVGIEVPNRHRATVSLREIVDTQNFQKAKSKLNVALGKDIAGNIICADIAKMPHLLIAGTTGSGKSVCLNSMIISLLYNATPDEVKLVMIDPKQVEFITYNGIPHLLVPVVSDPRKAAGALGWAVTEMLQRYKMFSEKNVRDIKGYNKLASTSDDIEPLPQIVIFIDELSDLMMVAPNEVEDSICRLAQMARAAGMHLVIATQRPSVNVITGIIKANIPSRIALSVSSQIDSRTIIDTAGAEKLLGNGDMLFNPVGVNKPVRVQGCFVSDSEVEDVVRFIKTNSDEKEYDAEVIKEIDRQSVIQPKKGSASSSGEGSDDADTDENIPRAIEVVVEAQMASTTLLQKKLKLGYARASRIIDELEERGIIGPFEGSKPRKVLISKQQWMEMNALGNASAPIENPILTDDEI